MDHTDTNDDTDLDEETGQSLQDSEIRSRDTIPLPAPKQLPSGAIRAAILEHIRERPDETAPAKTTAADRQTSDRTARRRKIQAIPLTLEQEALLKDAHAALPDANGITLKEAILRPEAMDGLPETHGTTEAYFLPIMAAGGCGLVRHIFYRNSQGTLTVKLIKSPFDPRIYPEKKSRVRHSQMLLRHEAQRMDIVAGFGKHPHIMDIPGADARDSEGQTHIILEKAGEIDGADFFEENTVTHEEVVHFLFQVMNGMEFLHNHGVIHRDLKWSNVMIDKDKKTAKIIDFGTLSAQPEEAEGPLERLNTINRIETEGGKSLVVTASILKNSPIGGILFDFMCQNEFYPEYDQLSLCHMIVRARDEILNKDGPDKGNPERVPEKSALGQMAVWAEKAIRAKSIMEFSLHFEKILDIRRMTAS